MADSDPSSSFAPKLVDLSSQNTVKSPFLSRRRAFIFGVISVVVLAIIAVLVGWYYIRQRITVPPKAVVNIDDSHWTKTNARGGQAQTQLMLINNGPTTVSVLFKREKYYCDTYKIEGPDNGPNPVLHCYEHGTAAWDANPVNIPPGGQSPVISVNQPVGGAGKCGAAQVDIWYKVNGGAAVGPFWGVAYLDPCAPPPPPPPPPPSLVCNSVTLGGGGNQIQNPGDSRTLTASASGGSGKITFSWAVTTDGSDKGQLSADKGNPVTWTAPASLPAAQTWQITATATDGKGHSDSSGCVQTLSYTPPPPPPPATHKECRNNACVSVDGAGQDNCPKNCQSQQTFQHKVCLTNNSCSLVDCSPNTQPCGSDCNINSDCGQAPPPSPAPTQQTHKDCQNNACVFVSGPGADQCTSDVSCKPAPTPPKIPKSGSDQLTIGGIVAGIGALIVGILIAL